MTATRINFSNLQDGKSPWLMPGSQAGLPRDVRSQAGIQAGSWLAGDGATACREIQRERTGASEQEQQGTALWVWERLWRTPLLLQVNESTTLGQESLPRGRSWRFGAGLFDFFSSRNGHLPFVFTATLVQPSEVQPWSSVPIPSSALWCYTAGEGILTQSKS